MENTVSILYIDDEEENLLGFKSSFSRLFNIVTATNTSAAKEILQNDASIGIVLVDYKMPDKDGIEFVNQIKSEFPEVVFIIISAWADVDVVIKAMNLNIFYGFIQKPWNFEELKITLKNASDLYKSTIENKRLNSLLLAKKLELEQAVEREREANRVKNVFLQNISHEIRTPLNSIIGFSYLIKNQTDDKKAHIFADFISQSGFQLLNTIQDILEVSLIYCNQFECKTTEFNLYKLVDEIITSFQDSIQQKKLFILNNLSKSISIEADMPKVHRILSSIISNAVKFTEVGGVTISCKENNVNDQLVIEVMDTGIGIENSKINEVFHPFRQIDETFSRKYGGNGIGLFIAKSYADFLGEDIWLESETGKGSSFYFSLKRKPIITFKSVLEHNSSTLKAV